MIYKISPLQNLKNSQNYVILSIENKRRKECEKLGKS